MNALNNSLAERVYIFQIREMYKKLLQYFKGVLFKNIISYYKYYADMYIIVYIRV